MSDEARERSEKWWDHRGHPAAERDFMAARSLSKQRNDKPRCTGRSSDELALFGLGLCPEPAGRPMDPDDMRACEITFAMAPPWVRKRMRPVLLKFRAHVAERYACVLLGFEETPMESLS